MTALQRALVALGALAVVVAAVVTLTVSGHDAGQLLGWAIPIVTGAWAVREVQASTAAQNGLLGELAAQNHEIAENVNGRLDARIRAAVRDVLAEPIPFVPTDRE